MSEKNKKAKVLRAAEESDTSLAISVALEVNILYRDTHHIIELLSVYVFCLFVWFANGFWIYYELLCLQASIHLFSVGNYVFVATKPCFSTTNLSPSKIVFFSRFKFRFFETLEVFVVIKTSGKQLGIKFFSGKL